MRSPCPPRGRVEPLRGCASAGARRRRGRQRRRPARRAGGASSRSSRPRCARRCRSWPARTSSATSALHAGDEVALLIPVAGGRPEEWSDRGHRSRPADGAARPSSSTRSPTALLGPDVPMLGPVADGGHIVVEHARPGCWGPMITPSIRGGHEVCPPVAVEGAERRRRDRDPHQATSRSPRSPPRPATTRRWRAASTATRTARRCARAAGPSGRRRASRASARRRSAARTAAPTRRRSRSPTATRSRSTRRTRSASPSAGEAAEAFAHDAARVAALPDNSIQNPILLFAPHDIVGARHAAAPVPGPARHVAVDDDPRLPQRRRLRLVPGRRAAPLRARRAAELQRAQDRRPHGHRRRPRRRDPRLPGQGRRRRRLPRRHARAAGRRRDRRPHRATSSGTVTLEVEVDQGPRHRRPGAVPGRRGPAVPGPAADRRRARPRARGARRAATASSELEESLPISVVGTGPDLNSATDNGLARAAELLGMTVPGGHEPGDDHRRDRDRPPPGRRAGHVPRARRPARGARPAGLRTRVLLRISSRTMSRRIALAAVAALLDVARCRSGARDAGRDRAAPGQLGLRADCRTSQPAPGRPAGLVPVVHVQACGLRSARDEPRRRSPA